MATVTVKRPVAPPPPPVESFLLELTEAEAVWLAGILLRVNGADTIYSPLARALDEQDVEYGINYVGIQQYPNDSETE